MEFSLTRSKQTICALVCFVALANCSTPNGPPEGSVPMKESDVRSLFSGKSVSTPQGGTYYKSNGEAQTFYEGNVLAIGRWTAKDNTFCSTSSSYRMVGEKREGPVSDKLCYFLAVSPSGQVYGNREGVGGYVPMANVLQSGFPQQKEFNALRSRMGL